LIRLHAIVEGQTEETFVNDVLCQHLGQFDISTDARCVVTSRRRGSRGGLSSYAQVKRDVVLSSKQDPNPDSFFTTMFDLYRLPSDFPAYEGGKLLGDPYARVKMLEGAFGQDIGRPRFVPYIQLHEFEALVLVDPDQLLTQFPASAKEVEQLSDEVSSFACPELIDEGGTTAPSKRIIRLIPEYEGRKPSVGPLVAGAIGIRKLKESCPHFSEWLGKLESLAA